MLASINACMHLPVSLGLVENSIGIGMLLRVLCVHVPLLALLLWLQKEGERGEFSLREGICGVFLFWESCTELLVCFREVDVGNLKGARKISCPQEGASAMH